MAAYPRHVCLKDTVKAKPRSCSYGLHIRGDARVFSQNLIAALAHHVGVGPGGGGGEGDSNMKMIGCVCWVCENLPILTDTFSCKRYPY